MLETFWGAYIQDAQNTHKVYLACYIFIYHRAKRIFSPTKFKKSTLLNEISEQSLIFQLYRLTTEIGRVLIHCFSITNSPNQIPFLGEKVIIFVNAFQNYYFS